MGDSNGFSHIKVTAADDDVVIHAGDVGTAGDSSVSRDGVKAASAAAPADTPAAAPAATPAATSAAASARKRQGKRDRYEEPSLEDLETPDMPLTQKIVIIAAVICIIGAIVYYFVFMR